MSKLQLILNEVNTHFSAIYIQDKCQKTFLLNFSLKLVCLKKFSDENQEIYFIWPKLNLTVKALIFRALTMLRITD